MNYRHEMITISVFTQCLILLNSVENNLPSNVQCDG